MAALQVPAERREDVRVAVPPSERQPAAPHRPLSEEDWVRHISKWPTQKSLP